MSDPLPLSEIFDHLLISSVEWTVQRNDEVSVTGDGSVFQSELADPLWTAPVTLDSRASLVVKKASALIRSLSGSKQPFLMCDPLSPWPAADYKGLLLGSGAVSVRAINANRKLASLSGLPAGYLLTVGDKIQITYGNPVQYSFVEVSRDAVANASGNMDVTIFPWLPLGLVVGAAVTLVRAACPVIIVKDSQKAGTARGFITEGAGFSVLQKRSRS